METLPWVYLLLEQEIDITLIWLFSQCLSVFLLSRLVNCLLLGLTMLLQV